MELTAEAVVAMREQIEAMVVQLNAWMDTEHLPDLESHFMTEMEDRLAEAAASADLLQDLLKRGGSPE